MKLLNIIKAVLNIKPYPLNEQWEKVDNTKQMFNKYAPVNLKSIKFINHKELTRPYISAEKITCYLNELKDIITFYTSEEAKESQGFKHVDDDQVSLFGEVHITIKGAIEKKDQVLEIKCSRDINESLELILQRTITHLSQNILNTKNLHIKLLYTISPPHTKWKKPPIFKELSF